MTKRKKRLAKPPKRKDDPKEPSGLVAFFANSPLVGSGIDLERKPDFGRNINLDESK
jgi:hypothetical protein